MRPYALVSRWAVALSREPLWDVVDELLASADPLIWWPSVQVSGYDGTSMRVRTASAFGYTLTFSLADLEADRPDSLRFTATGELSGTGVVSFVDSGAGSCVLDIDWRVTTNRGWMRRTGWLLRPLFVAGHHLVMRQGERHFRRWLDERESRGRPGVV